MPEDAFNTWGWRVPFLLSFLVIVAGYVIRRKVEEGASEIPMTIGAITFVITIVAAAAAWSARETHRIPLNDLGIPGARPMGKTEYEEMRQQALEQTRA